MPTADPPRVAADELPPPLPSDFTIDAPAPATAIPGKPHAVLSFTYQAQSDDGHRITGTVDAADPADAVRRLEALRLRVIEIQPLENRISNRAPKSAGGGNGRALRGDEFIAFNQQLAHLARAGLPVEAGLRLIAKDLRRGHVAQTIGLVADELDRGTPIAEAFDKYRSRFPSLYGRLLDAGVRSGDLGGVLLGFGRHLELVQRLRAALWRTFAYPVTVLLALSVLLTFLGIYVLPQFETLYNWTKVNPWANFNLPARTSPGLPWPTEVLFSVAKAIPWVAGSLAVLILASPALWALTRAANRDRAVIDSFVLRLPLIGRALRLNMIARWCDALRIGVTAGMPLPDAIGLAGDAVRSPRLRRDGATLSAALENGERLSAVEAGRMTLLPATVPAAIELSAGHHDLPHTLQTLADLYERQAELRVNRIPAVLTPLLVVVVAVTIGSTIIALVLPLLRIIDQLVK